jgi:hypothetical protein
MVQWESEVRLQSHQNMMESHRKMMESYWEDKIDVMDDVREIQSSCMLRSTGFSLD